MLVDQGITGKRILVIEEDFVDELAIASEFTPGLAGNTFDVHDQTIAMLEGSDVGAAILDGHLDHEKTWAIVQALTELGIPFVVSDSGFPMAPVGSGQLTAELTLLAHQLFGAPTFH